MTATVVAAPRTMVSLRLVGVGVVLGVAWSAGLRSFMAQLAGPDSHVTWSGTFLGVILPGAAVGGLFGWAEHLRRTGRRRGRLALAPLLFPIAALSLPGAIRTLVTTGQGSGAIGIAVLGMLGGYALSGRGPLWGRIVCGAPGIVLVLAAFLSPPMRPELDPATPLGAWVSTLFSAQLVTLAIACAIPLRAVPGQARS